MGAISLKTDESQSQEERPTLLAPSSFSSKEIFETGKKW